MNKQQLANRIWASANNMRNKFEANEYKETSAKPSFIEKFPFSCV